MCDRRELRSRAVGGNGRRRQRSKQNMASPDDFAADSLSPRTGTIRSHQTLPVDASPDSKCPICLDRFENVASLDRCGHRFCFRCVQEWSKNKAECPLCKQPFHSIRHSMRSKDDFQVYNIRSSETDSFANPDGRRFRYRTTLTRESRTSVCPRRTSSSRRTVSPPDNGILFEGLSSQPTRHRDAEMHQMIRRLASRRQASMEGRSMRQIQEQEIINFRRSLYRSGIRVRSIEDGGRYRDISAEFFRRNPACLHRLVPWLKRELTVLFGAHGSLVNIVQHIIMSNVTRYDLESQAFAEDLKPFLLHRTEHFLHEFISFARCPFNIEAYDQHANYDCPAPSYEEGSRSESSIITISPDEAESECNAFSTGIGQALWDDETPGPSYSSSDQVHAPVSATVDSSESSDEEPSANTVLAGLQRQLQGSVETNGDSGDSSDNCVIVGYVKPLAERTPELVQLSSDSEESIDGGTTEDVKKVEPIQCHSGSDTDISGYSSPFSIGSRDDVSPFKTNAAFSNKIKSKRSDRKKARKKEFDGQILLPSSPTKREDDPDYRLSRKRKSDPYAHHSHSRERHGLKSKKKHNSMEIQKKKRDGSRHKHKQGKKRSRTRDKSLSRKSQDLSSESIVSREPSRSRSRSNEYSKRRSASKHNDYYSRDDYQSKYRWEYTIYSRNTSRGNYESSYRRWTQTRARYSRQSTRPDYGIESFSERTNSRNPRGHNDNWRYYDERYRSRSRSSSRSRSPPRGSDRTRSEKPSGKRKYKTRHLESAHRGNEASSPKKERTLQKSLPKCMDSYKKTTSFSERQLEDEISHKKRKKTSRSPSVEIIYEGKATRHHKKKRKSHKSHIGYSPFSSPVVITIDSGSDKDFESQDNTECGSSISWHSTVQQNERDTESLSSPIESQDCSYLQTDEIENIDKDCSCHRTDEIENVDKDCSYHRIETENIDKDCNVTTTRVDVGDETLSGFPQLEGTANGHESTMTDSDISFVAGNPPSNRDRVMQPVSSCQNVFDVTGAKDSA